MMDNQKDRGLIPEMVEEGIEYSPYVSLDDPERGPLLSMASQPCTFPLTHADQDCIVELGDRLDVEGEGALGIAAVQIGYPKQIFVMRDADGSNLFCINPQITSKSQETSKRMEGCLSIRNFGTNPIRPKSVTLSFMTPEGLVEERTFKGLASRVVCHEMDHLEGILLVNHMEIKVEKHTKSLNKKKHLKRKRVARNRAAEKRRRKTRKSQRG